MATRRALSRHLGRSLCARHALARPALPLVTVLGSLFLLVELGLIGLQFWLLRKRNNRFLAELDRENEVFVRNGNNMRWQISWLYRHLYPHQLILEVGAEGAAD